MEQGEKQCLSGHYGRIQMSTRSTSSCDEMYEGKNNFDIIDPGKVVFLTF
jgi:hypothetical protein